MHVYTTESADSKTHPCNLVLYSYYIRTYHCILASTYKDQV